MCSRTTAILGKGKYHTISLLSRAVVNCALPKAAAHETAGDGVRAVVRSAQSLSDRSLGGHPVRDVELPPPGPPPPSSTKHNCSEATRLAKSALVTTLSWPLRPFEYHAAPASQHLSIPGLRAGYRQHVAHALGVLFQIGKHGRVGLLPAIKPASETNPAPAVSFREDMIRTPQGGERRPIPRGDKQRGDDASEASQMLCGSLRSSPTPKSV